MALGEEEDLEGGVEPPELPVALAAGGPADVDEPEAVGGSTGLSAGGGVLAEAGRALAAAARLTPLLALVRREEGWREEGVAMDRAGGTTAEKTGGRRGSTVWIPEINDPRDGQVGLGLGVAGGEAGGGATGGEHPVAG